MNYKFIPMYRESSDGKKTILESHKLNEYKEVSTKGEMRNTKSEVRTEKE